MQHEGGRERGASQADHRQTHHDDVTGTVVRVHVRHPAVPDPGVLDTDGQHARAQHSEKRDAAPVSHEEVALPDHVPTDSMPAKRPDQDSNLGPTP